MLPHRVGVVFSRVFFRNVIRVTIFILTSLATPTHWEFNMSNAISKKRYSEYNNFPHNLWAINTCDKSKLVMLLVKLGYGMVHEILHLKFFFGRSIFG